MIQGLLFEKHPVTHPSLETFTQPVWIISFPHSYRDPVDTILNPKGEIQFICSLRFRPWEIYIAKQNGLNLSKIEGEESQSG